MLHLPAVDRENGHSNSERRDSAPITFSVRRGEQVHGVTGVVVTTKLGRAVVRAPLTLGSDGVALQPGELISVLHYVGEGAWKVWARGSILDAVEIAAKRDRCGGQRGDVNRCALQMLDPPRTVWWVYVRNHGGQEGWTRQVKHFGGIDACE